MMYIITFSFSIGYDARRCFHAYHTISAEATAAESVISVPPQYADCAASITLVNHRTAKTAPTMIFNQRFSESFKVRDRKAIIIGTSIKIAKNNIIPGLIFWPSAIPAINCAMMPGSISTII